MGIIPTPGDGFWPGEDDGGSAHTTISGPPGTTIRYAVNTLGDGDTITLNAGDAFVAGYYPGEYGYPDPGTIARGYWRIVASGTGTIAVSDYLDDDDSYEWRTDPNSVTYTPRGTLSFSSTGMVARMVRTDDAVTTAVWSDSTMVGRFEVTSGTLTLDFVAMRVEPEAGLYAKTGRGAWSRWYAGKASGRSTQKKWLVVSTDSGGAQVSTLGTMPSYGEALPKAEGLIPQVAAAAWKLRNLNTVSPAHDRSNGQVWYFGGIPVYGTPSWTVNWLSPRANGMAFSGLAPSPNWSAVTEDEGDWGLHWEGIYSYTGEVQLIRWELESTWSLPEGGYETVPGIKFNPSNMEAGATANHVSDYPMMVPVDIYIKGFSRSEIPADHEDAPTSAPWAGASVLTSVMAGVGYELGSPEQEPFLVNITTLPPYDGWVLGPLAPLGQFGTNWNAYPVVSYPEWRYWRPEWEVVTEDVTSGMGFVMVTADCT